MALTFSLVQHSKSPACTEAREEGALFQLRWSRESFYPLGMVCNINTLVFYPRE